MNGDVSINKQKNSDDSTNFENSDTQVVKFKGHGVSNTLDSSKLSESAKKADKSSITIFKEKENSLFLEISELGGERFTASPTLESANKMKEAAAEIIIQQEIVEEGDEDFFEDFQESESELDETSSQKEQAKEEKQIITFQKEQINEDLVKSMDASIIAKDNIVKAKISEFLSINETNIAKNETNIAKNETNISKNETNIAKNETNIAKNETTEVAIASTEAKDEHSLFLNNVENLINRFGDLYFKEQKISLRDELDHLRGLQKQMKVFPSSASLKEEFDSSLQKFRDALAKEQLFIFDPKTNSFIPLSQEQTKLFRQEVELIFIKYFDSISLMTETKKTDDEKKQQEEERRLKGLHTLLMKPNQEFTDKVTRYDAIAFEAKALFKDDPSLAKFLILLKILEKQAAALEFQKDLKEQKRLDEKIRILHWIIMKNLATFELNQENKKEDYNKASLLAIEMNKKALDIINIRKKLV